MNKKEVLKVYGEYNIPFEIAKNMKEYKFSLKNEDIPVLEEYRFLFNEISEDDNDYYGGEEVLEFGNIDIELNITKRASEYKKNILDFFICIKTKEGWESYDFSDYTLTLEDLKDVETLERTMYRELMKYAKKYNLYWSKYN